MAVLRLDRFTIDPADTGELLTRHAALVAAAKDAFPGLIEVQLAKVDEPAREERVTAVPRRGSPRPARLVERVHNSIRHRSSRSTWAGEFPHAGQ
jgi:hypothetical protein